MSQSGPFIIYVSETQVMTMARNPIRTPFAARFLDCLLEGPAGVGICAVVVRPQVGDCRLRPRRPKAAEPVRRANLAIFSSVLWNLAINAVAAVIPGVFPLDVIL